MTKAPAPEMQGPRRQASPQYSTRNPFDEIAGRVESPRPVSPARDLVRSLSCRCSNEDHDDKHPSMTVSETADGSVLLHCFGGCSFEQMVSGLGLEPIDLIPPHLRHNRQDGHRSPHKGPRFSPWTALQALAVDVIVVALAAAQIRRDGWLDDADLEALIQAEARIQSNLRSGGLLR